jgi:hypothetical protein
VALTRVTHAEPIRETPVELAERRSIVPPSRVALKDKVAVLLLVVVVCGWTLALAALVYLLVGRL